MENNENFGDIKISEDVVSVIAFLASKNVVGVSSMQNSFGTGIAEFLGKKSTKKGVKVSIVDKDVTVDVYVIIEYGVKIQEVAKTIQESVKNEVEKTTGLNVLFVNVHIEGVNLKNKNDDIKDDDEQYYEEDYSGQCDGGCSGCNGGCSVEDEDL